MSPVRPAKRAQCPGCERMVWLTVHNTLEEHDVDQAGYYGIDCDWGGTPIDTDDETDGES